VALDLDCPASAWLSFPVGPEVEMRKSSIRNAALASVAAFLAMTGVWVLQARAATESDVQAAYLFNFVRFVEWPDSAFASTTAPVRICVLGQSDFVDVATASINGKSVGEREVVVESTQDVLGSRGCHILYVDPSRREDEDEVLSTYGRHSVLTVSDSDDFAERGGVANFVTVDDKVRFVINKNAADAAGLKISSRLLRIAQVVE
jgi:hypothetical protein